MQLFENVSNEKCKWMHTTEMYVCDNTETACNTWGKTFGTGPLTNINRLRDKFETTGSVHNAKKCC